MQQGRRHNVEIYFILYLAALIFLLPGPGDDDPDQADISTGSVATGPFSLHSIPTLYCTVANDSAGPRIVEIDSVNTIFYDGEVRDVHFEFVVTDLMKRQKLMLRSGDSRKKYFRFDSRLDQHLVRFYWEPPLLETGNKMYHVKVKATALMDNADNRGTIDESVELQAETEFSLNVIYLDEAGARNPEAQQYAAINNIDTVFIAQSNNNYNNNQYQWSRSEEISFQVNPPAVKAVAYGKWTNQIIVFNANLKNDLVEKPVVKASLDPPNSGGSARLASYEISHLTLTGKTPGNGSMNVSVSMRFRGENKERTVTFKVAPMPITTPVFVAEQYPGKTYEINPEIKEFMNQDIKAVIKDGSEIRAVSDQGGAFNFTPDISDTGKTLIFERYIDNNLYGQKYKIRVLTYPPPIVDNIQFGKDKEGEPEVKITTFCYGIHRNRENQVTLKVDGNIQFQELRGNIPNNPDEITQVQFFRGIPLNADKPFEFTVRAIDSWGRTSEVKTARRGY